MRFADYGFEETYFTETVYSEYPPENVPYGEFGEQIDGIVGGKTLVVGCGTGCTLTYMDDAYGMDISEWAVNNAEADVYLGDALDHDRYREIAQDTPGESQWDGIYTEFLLSHFTDESAREVCEITRTESGGPVVHRIWSGSGEEQFNLKTVSEWQEAVGEHRDVEWIDYDRPEDSTI